MRHKVYDVIDDQFKNFVRNNKDELGRTDVGSIRPIDDFPHCVAVRGYPSLIVHVGKQNGVEGPIYVFIDNNMDKVYSYYDVEDRISEGVLR